jgi:hypothetical protein
VIRWLKYAGSLYPGVEKNGSRLNNYTINDVGKKDPVWFRCILAWGHRFLICRVGEAASGETNSGKKAKMKMVILGLRTYLN